MEATNLKTLQTRHLGIIWGDAKTGKTTWAATLPGHKLLVNFDPDGFMSIADRDDIDVLNLAQYEAGEAINQGKKVGAYILENADKYDSVIVDSLTTLAEFAMYDAVKRGVGKSASFTPTIDAPGLSAYGGRNNNVNDVVGKIIRATAQKEMHCFFIAHSDDPEYDKDGKNIVQQTIMLSAKIRNMAALKVSEIYHINLGTQNRRTVYLAPFGVKKPMGSRIFDTKQFPSFELKYDPAQPDAGQRDTLAAIFTAWDEGGRRKLTGLKT